MENVQHYLGCFINKKQEDKISEQIFLNGDKDEEDSDEKKLLEFRNLLKLLNYRSTGSQRQLLEMGIIFHGSKINIAGNILKKIKKPNKKLGDE